MWQCEAIEIQKLVPSLPVLIACPPTLMDQWEKELRKYLQPRTYDIYPITQTAKTRKIFNVLSEKSFLPKHRQIFLVSHTVRYSIVVLMLRMLTMSIRC